MKILFEPGAETIVGSIGGDTFYIQDGRAICRQKVKAIEPNSELRMKENSAVVAASKGWSSLLSPTRRAAWEAAAPPAIGGFDWWVWIWSIFDWIFDLPPPFDPPIGDFPDLDFDSFVFDSCTPSLSVSFVVTGGVGDEKAWLLVSPPGSLGRVPSLRSMRTIGRGLSVGVELDLTAAYLSVFGRFPAEGEAFVAAARVASRSTGAPSDIVVLRGFTVCGGGGSCSFQSPLVIPAPGGSTANLGFASFPDASMLSLVSAVVTGGGLSINLGSPFSNGNTVPLNVVDDLGVARSGNSSVRFTSLETGQICLAPFAFVVQP